MCYGKGGARKIVDEKTDGYLGHEHSTRAGVKSTGARLLFGVCLGAWRDNVQKYFVHAHELLHQL